MERVKIFTRGFTDEALEIEEKVNRWLRRNPGIEILSRQASIACGVNIMQKTFVNCTIVIFYRPAPEKCAEKK